MSSSSYCGCSLGMGVATGRAKQSLMNRATDSVFHWRLVFRDCVVICSIGSGIVTQFSVSGAGSGLWALRQGLWARVGPQ